MLEKFKQASNWRDDAKILLRLYYTLLQFQRTILEVGFIYERHDMHSFVLLLHLASYIRCVFCFKSVLRIGYLGFLFRLRKCKSYPKSVGVYALFTARFSHKSYDLSEKFACHSVIFIYCFCKRLHRIFLLNWIRIFGYLFRQAFVFTHHKFWCVEWFGSPGVVGWLRFVNGFHLFSNYEKLPLITT